MKFFQILAFVALGTQLSGTLIAAEITPRIVGGTAVAEDKYPFMASIYYNTGSDFKPGCGGSFIGERWILTAAHCVVDAGLQLNPSEIGVVLGTTDLTDQAIPLRSVRRIIAHPEYNIKTHLNDIALLELDLPFSGIPIRLPATNSGVPALNESGTVAGWGDTLEDGTGSPTLLEVSIPVVSHESCLQVPTYAEMLQREENFCAGGGAGGKDSCQGDSGGPIFVTRGNVIVQAGIVSYGEGCARPQVPGVYTRLSNYTDWVNNFATTEIFAGGSPPQVFPTTNTNPSAGSSSGSGSVDLAALALLLSWLLYRQWSSGAFVRCSAEHPKAARDKLL